MKESILFGLSEQDIIDMQREENSLETDQALRMFNYISEKH